MNSGSSINIGISGEAVDQPGRFGVRRYEDYEEEEDWN